MGIKDRKHNNSEDSTLFRNAVGEIQPVNTRNRNLQSSKPPAKVLQRRREERKTLEEALHNPTEEAKGEPTEGTSFQRGTVSRKRMRELRGGKVPVRDDIDLHGLTRQEAKPLLHGFIHACAHSGIACVLVVHGKGMRSGTAGPVLKNAVNRWLRDWETVLAFCPARSCDGGAGAVYVLLKTASK
jgi:DNA-nicking Smr family endonuclease